MHPRAESIPLILDVCRRLAARGFVAATDGNVSVRLADGNILTTRSGVSKGAMAESDLVEVTPEGIRRSGEGKPSTELGMHLAIYRARSDVNAVVHAHPVYATGFAAARVALDAPVFPEVVAVFGGIPLAPYATPSTGEVEASIAPFLKTHEAILLSNHGAVTYAASLEEAFRTMEKVEQIAHMTFVARSLGGAVTLTPEERERLAAAGEKNYGKNNRKTAP